MSRGRRSISRVSRRSISTEPRRHLAMGQPAAKKGDRIVATDMHLTQAPPASPVLVPHPFTGIIDGGLSPDVNIMGRPAATQGSTATNTPSHVPIGGSFVKPPANKGTIQKGSLTVN